MKRCFCFIMCIVMTFSLIACEKTGNAEECSITGCTNPVYKDGLCPDHYVAAHTADIDKDDEVDVEKENKKEVDENIDEKEVEESETKEVEEKKTYSLAELGEIGLKNIKFDTNRDLTPEESMVAEYFNKDYIFVNDIESLQRYNKIFNNALIQSYVYVEKVISYEGDDYSLLVKMINNSDEFSEFDAPLSSLKENRRMIINGTTGDARYIVGDVIQINGRYKGVETREVDGVSITVPIIDIARSYLVDKNDPDGWWYVEKPSRFSDKEVKQIAKCIFGEDIMVRKDIASDYGLDPAIYGDAFGGSEIEGYTGPCYVCELDNQSNAKFSRYFFNERLGTMTDAVHENYELSFSGDFKHFYLFMYDEKMETLTLEYYDSKLNKLWKREFEETTSASYDVTEDNIYLCANNEFYIIDCKTGKDTCDSTYIGNKLDIRKFASGTLAIGAGKSDAFMFIDNKGQVKWKVNATKDVKQGYNNAIQTQEVDGNLVIKVEGDFKDLSPSEEMPHGGHGYQYYYYVINIDTGELVYSGDVVTSDFQKYG